MAEALGVRSTRGASPRRAALDESDRAFASAGARRHGNRAALDERIGEARELARRAHDGARSAGAAAGGARMLAHPETPPRVVIDEAIELARRVQRGGRRAVRQRRARRRPSARDEGRGRQGRRASGRGHVRRRSACRATKKPRSRSAAPTSTRSCPAKLGLQPCEPIPTGSPTTSSRHTVSALVAAHGDAGRSRARGLAGRDGHRRPRPEHPQLRQGRVPGALGRARRACRSTCGRIRCPSATIALSRLLDFGDLDRRAGPPVPHQDQRAVDLGVQPEFLAKCFVPLPEKWHGLQDVETAIGSGTST
jgi:hypothetical protein